MTTTVLAKTTPLWKTRTFWMGVIEIVAGVAVLAVDEVSRATEAGEPIGWGLIAKGFVTMALRYFTRQPVTLGGTPAKPVDAPTRADMLNMPPLPPAA